MLLYLILFLSIRLEVTDEVGSQRSEVRSRKSEVRSQKSEVGSQRSEGRGQRFYEEKEGVLACG